MMKTTQGSYDIMKKQFSKLVLVFTEMEGALVVLKYLLLVLLVKIFFYSQDVTYGSLNSSPWELEGYK